ncbi:MAG: IS481 family transposase, partial [Chloroflexi bacterium]|nr:IS481 family transposase [Chloroflexota bacterium]
ARPQAKVGTHFRILHDKDDRHGKLSLRSESRLLHIGVGARHKGLAVVMLVADRDVRVVSAADGELLRHLTIDPTRNYQRQSA